MTVSNDELGTASARAVIAATNYSNAGESTEAFEVDALGNRTRKQQNGCLR